MKFVVAFMGLCALWTGRVYGQIQILAGEMQENRFAGEVLYAIRDEQGGAPFGRVVFAPAAGGPGWEFAWTYQGQPRTVAYSSDSSYMEADLLGDGRYTFEARRGGESESNAFHVFFDHVPRYTIQLTDVYDCSAISIGGITDFVFPDYTYQGKSYNASGGYQRKVEYLVSGTAVPWEFETYEQACKPREHAVAVSSEDMEVTVTITDLFGIKWTSEPAKYTSVIPKADWEIEYGNTVPSGAGGQNRAGQAPLEVRFHNNSVNADEFRWYLFKDTADLGRRELTLEDSLLDHRIRMERELDYTYENPGRYRVQLVAIRSEGNRCQDTIDSQYVCVVASLVDVPNVFTPNGDGKNDVFRVQGLSVESFEAIILNRWGRKVYEWHDPSGGWDGRINGKYASPGTYFYIVTARGREKSNSPQYVRKGSLLLVR